QIEHRHCDTLFPQERGGLYHQGRFAHLARGQHITEPSLFKPLVQPAVGIALHITKGVAAHCPASDVKTALKTCFGCAHSLCLPAIDRLTCQAFSNASQPHCLLLASTSCSVAARHSCTIPSVSPDASHLPSGEKATDKTTFECPLSVSNSCPVVASLSSTVPLRLPEASLFPSGEKATEVTNPECPSSVSSSFPVVMSHSFTVPSRLPEASLFPSVEKAIEKTSFACHPRASSSFPVATSHSFTIPSRLPEASLFPSGEKITEETLSS